MALLSFFNRSFRPEEPKSTRSMFFGNSGGTNITADTAMEVSPFYRGVIYISTQVAKLPAEVKDEDFNIVKNHHVRKLVKIKPNPEMNYMMFMLWLIQTSIIKGNAYCEIERNNAGMPIAIWPIPHHYVCPIRDQDDGSLWYRVANVQGRQRDVFVPAKNMFHLRNFHTLDGITGMSIVEYATEILGIAKGADKFSNSTFANGAHPSGVLEYPGKLSEEAEKRLLKSWKEQHGGRKTGGTAVLQEGAKYNPITSTMEDLQFIDTKKMSVKDIARFLGLPPSKLFDTDAATFNNIENSNLEVATDTLDAWVRNFEMECNDKLLNQSYKGYQVELDIYQIFRGDMETRGEYFNKMMQVSGINPNEIRKKEGLPSYEGGEKFYIANNNFAPIDRIDEIIDSQVKGKETDQQIAAAFNKRLENKKKN